MSRIKISILNQLLLLIFLYILIANITAGITTQPSELDSISYHIPLAEKILDGTILTNPLGKTQNTVLFYPAASEIILALFIFFHIPLNLFNVLGFLILFVSLYQLGRTFRMQKEACLTFSLAISTLTVFTRWLSTQIVDIWLLVFFIWSLILMEKSWKRNKYFVPLGLTAGFLIGSKISGILFFGVLLTVYGKTLIKKLNILKTAILLMIIGIFGLTWYIRNYTLTNNPFYPLDFLFLHGVRNSQFYRSSLIKVLFQNNINQFINALLSEYVLWSLVLMSTPLYILKSFLSKRNLHSNISKLVWIGMLNLTIFLILPSWDKNIISSFRYSYVAFVPLILAVFLSNQFASIIPIISFLSSIGSLQLLSHQPKILILTFLVNIMIIYCIKSIYLKIKSTAVYIHSILNQIHH